MRPPLSGHLSTYSVAGTQKQLTLLGRFYAAIAAVFRQVAPVATAIALTSCGSSPPPPPPPQSVAVSVSPSSASVLLGSTQQFTSTVTGSSNTAVNWSVDGIAGGNSTVGTISSNGLYTAPADLRSSIAINVTATSQADNTKSGNASVALKSDITVALSANPAAADFVQTGGVIQLTATVASAGNPDRTVNWSVNGALNGNSTVGTISITGPNTATFTGPSSIPSPNTVNIQASSVADSTKSASMSIAVVTLIGITAIDRTIADPFTPLTVSGTGFTQGSLAISVMYLPENGNSPITIPASVSNATTVQAMVPPIFNSTLGGFESGIVDVEVVAFSGNQTFISNRITGLQINTLPPVPAGVTVGTMTAAYLLSGLTVSGSVHAAEISRPAFSNLVAALTQSDADTNSLLSSVGVITTNPTQTVQLTLANQATATLDANTLALTDQVVQAIVGAIINAGPIPPGGSPVNCPPSTNNPTFDANLCSIQTFFQSLAGQSPAAAVSRRSKIVASVSSSAASVTVQQAADKALLTLAIGGIASVVPGGLPVEIAIGVLGSYISTSVTTGSTPGGSENVATVGTTVADHYAFHGVPVLGTLKDFVDIVQAATSDAPPQPGVVLSTGMAEPLPGGGTAVTYLDSNGNPTATLIKVPDAPQEVVDSTQFVIPPQPVSKLSVAEQGTGSGSVVSFPQGISCPPSCSADFPTGVVVGLEAEPSGGSLLDAWSGACSGPQGCGITMSGDETVTAVFNPAVTFSGTFAATGLEKAYSIPECTIVIQDSFSLTVTAAVNGNAVSFSGPASMTRTINSLTGPFPNSCFFLPNNIFGTIMGTTSVAPDGTISVQGLIDVYDITYTGSVGGTAITGILTINSVYLDQPVSGPLVLNKM